MERKYSYNQATEESVIGNFIENEFFYLVEESREPFWEELKNKLTQSDTSTIIDKSIESFLNDGELWEEITSSIQHHLYMHIQEKFHGDL